MAIRARVVILMLTIGSRSLRSWGSCSSLGMAAFSFLPFWVGRSCGFSPARVPWPFRSAPGADSARRAAAMPARVRPQLLCRLWPSFLPPRETSVVFRATVARESCVLLRLLAVSAQCFRVPAGDEAGAIARYRCNPNVERHCQPSQTAEIQASANDRLRRCSRHAIGRLTDSVAAAVWTNTLVHHLERRRWANGRRWRL